MLLQKLHLFLSIPLRKEIIFDIFNHPKDILITKSRSILKKLIIQVYNSRTNFT
jgi:hypothetical protein